MEPGDEGRKRSVEGASHAHCKILKGFKDFIEFHPTNLEQILSTCEDTSLPVSIIAVIGEGNVGKTLLTNLLIHYYENQGEGGWIPKLTKKDENGKQKLIHGFAWGGVKHSSFIQGEATGGVYIWPEAFKMKKFNSENDMLVYILHIDHGLEENTKSVPGLEQFLMLACSRIVEIKTESCDQLRILEHCHQLKDEKSLCDSIVYVFRSIGGSSSGFKTTKESKKLLCKEMSKMGKTDARILENFNYVNVLEMKECSKAIHDSSGYFNQDAVKLMTKDWKKMVDTITEDNEVGPKMVSEKKELTVAGMISYFQKCSDQIYNKFCQAQGDVSNGNTGPPPIPDVPLPSDSDEEDFEKSFEVIHQNEVPKNEDNEAEAVPSSTEHCPTAMTKEKLSSKECENKFNQNYDKQRPKFISQYDPHSPSKFESTPTTILSSSEIPANIESGTSEADKVPPQKASLNSAYFPPQNCTTTKVPNATQGKQATVLSAANNNSLPNHGTSETPGSDGNLEKMDVDNVVNSTDFHVTEGPQLMDVDDTETEDAAEKVRQLSEQQNVSDEQRQQAKNEEKARQKLEKQQIAHEAERQRQETRRQEEALLQEARRHMENDSIPTATMQIKEFLTRGVPLFIKDNMNMNNVKNFETLYDTAFREVCACSDQQYNYKNIIHPTVFEKFSDRVRENLKEERLLIEKCQETILKFLQGVKKKFQFNGCFTDTKALDRIFEQEFGNVVKNLDGSKPELRRNVEMACGKLKQIFQSHNQIIIEVEQQNARNYALEVKNFYNEEMARYLKIKFYSPEQLQQLNEKLTEKCLAAFTNAFNLSAGKNDAIGEERSNLPSELERSFSKHKDSNEMKLKKVQMEINKIVQANKTKYVEKMEDLLRRNQDGLFPRDLEQNHDTTKAEVKTLFQMEVRRKIGENEPLDVHWKSLDIQIQKYFQDSVKKDNAKNIQRKEDEEKERKKREDGEKRRKQDEENERRKQQQKKAEKRNQEEKERQTNSRASSYDGRTRSGASYQRPSSGSVGSGTTNDTRTNLPPLVFQLSHSRVVMAMNVNGNPKLLQNELGESYTPAVVGLTKESRLVHGTEAVVRMNENVEEDEKLIQCWYISQFLVTGKQALTETIFTNNSSLTVTLEFLLGYLLKKLKTTVEVQMKRKCDSTVITVPFWFSSTQRIQVKDAARVAGFTKAYLVNEAAAAAFACASTELRHDSAENILVLLESSGRVDASVYSYNGHHKTVKMLSHSGNYCLEEKSRSEKVKRVIVNFFASIKHWWTDFGDDELKDEVTTLVKKACKHAFNVSQDSKKQSVQHLSKPTETLTIWESEKWKDLLDSVGKIYGKKASGINEVEAVVRGAVLLSLSPNKIGTKVKDKLVSHVLRTCGPDCGTRVIEKSDELPIEVKKCSTTLGSGYHEVEFFQDLMDSRISIGHLKVSGVQSGWSIKVDLQISHEGIVTLKQVFYHPKTNSSATCLVHDDYIHWSTPNLSEERLTEFASLLESMEEQSSHATELAKQKEALEKSSNSLRQLINNGEIKFRSPLAMEMALKKVEEALRFANHEKSTAAEIERQISDIATLLSKHQPNFSRPSETSL